MSRDISELGFKCWTCERSPTLVDFEQRGGYAQFEVFPVDWIRQ